MTDKKPQATTAKAPHKRRGMTPVRLVKGVEDAVSDAANLDAESSITDLIEYLEGLIVLEAKNR